MEKLHTDETILKKNLAIAMVVLHHSHGVKNAEVWAVDADTRIVHIGVRTILDAIIR